MEHVHPKNRSWKAGGWVGRAIEAAGFWSVEQSGRQWTRVARSAGWALNTRIHGIGDGAEWIESQFAQHFGRHGSYTLDLYHVCEKLALAAPEAGKAREYVKASKAMLKQNQSGQIIAELAGRREPEQTSEENAPVRSAHRYLDKRCGQLDYKTALAKGLPVGSGLIESAHRRVLQARLKIPGAWWHPDNAHAMAQSCVCRANGQWASLWN